MYYNNPMSFITSQPSRRQDVPPSVLEANAVAVTLANEWENEWNQTGLASRLSKEVDVVVRTVDFSDTVEGISAVFNTSLLEHSKSFRVPLLI